MELVIAALLLVSVVDAIRRPTIRRLALRNLTRRRGEAALVVLGSMLGTAIITAAFIAGDTLGASVRDEARTYLGPADEMVAADGLDATAPIFDDLRKRPVAHTDGLLRLNYTGVSVSTVGSDPRAEPNASLAEVDFDEARAFGGDESATGMASAGATPTDDRVVVTKSLARKLDLGVGDRVHVYGFGNARDLVVRNIVVNKGIAGFVGRGLFAPRGTIASLLEPMPGAPAEVLGRPPSSLVLVSNDGGVFDGAELTAPVTKELRDRVASFTGVEVHESKQDRLEAGENASAQFTQILSTVGAFSVIAGIVLLVTIFVMLAEERKSELGMLRAIGMKRNQLVRAFGMEGAVYSVVSAALGVVVGIGVGRLVAGFAANIFSGGFDGGFNLVFALTRRSLSLGFMLGALTALVTVWGTSIWVGRLNVIRAIRDLPEPPSTGRRRMRSHLFASMGVLAGLTLLGAGIANDNWFGALAGVPIASASSIRLLQAFASRRIAILAGCGGSLLWGLVVFSILPDAFVDADLPSFVVQGVILVASGVAVVATNDDIASWFVGKLGVSKRTLAARLGFAYPLARVFRTSMLMGMFAIIIFTMTFMSVFSHLFAAQAPRFAREAAAGYDVLVDSNYSNPVPAPVLRQQKGVTAVATLEQSYPAWTQEKKRWPVSGFDQALLAKHAPELGERLPRFRDDREVWEAVLHDPTLVILPANFLLDGFSPSDGFPVGGNIELFDSASGHSATLTIAAKIDNDFIGNGAMVGQAFMRSLVSDVSPSRHYVAVASGRGASEVADRLTAKLIAYGVDASTFESRIGEQLDQQQGFLSLMQGYMGLGLVIGIAGLGVVMVRAVRERRRQIGMLRAMGFSSRIVRHAFLVEASFLAVQGIVLGTVLALATTYTMLTHSAQFGGQPMPFQIPVRNIFVVSFVALAASLASSAFPAHQASKIRPAVALRITY